MKITKTQLRKIIKEEILRESNNDAPISLLTQANDKLGDALNMMDGLRGQGSAWTAQSELIDTHYDTLVGIYQQIQTIKDELAQAGRR